MFTFMILLLITSAWMINLTGTVNFLKFRTLSLFFFINKIETIMAGINNILVRIVNREDPDQTASSEAVCFGSALLV